MITDQNEGLKQKIKEHVQINSPVLAQNTVVATFLNEFGTICKSHAEFLRRIEGKPVAICGVSTERQAMVRICRVDKIHREISAVSGDEAGTGSGNRW